MSQLKFRAWHPKYGKMFDFGLNKYSLETITPKIKHIDLGNGYSVLDPKSLIGPTLYVRAGLKDGLGKIPDKDYSVMPPPNMMPMMVVIDVEDPDLKIMRYLGEECLDCNLIELCEDDIVKYKGRIFRIIYFNGRFVLDDNSGAFVLDWSTKPEWQDCQKLGNFYQNPELFKEEQQHELSTS